MIPGRMMKSSPLMTHNEAIRLIEPDVERDARYGVDWLSGEVGKKTLLSMGNAPEEIGAPSLETERQRVKDFIERPDQLNWMIELDGSVVGSVWVDLEDTEFVKSPAVHIMIGDESARGRGVGSQSVDAVLQYLADEGHESIYSRHLASNNAAKNLLFDLGFIQSGDTYTDKDGLVWQNVEKH